MVDRVWIGLDIGTTNIKAAAYLQNGTCVAKAAHNTKIIRNQTGAAEQDMNEVWRIVLICLRDITQQCKLYKIMSLGLCAQGDGLWAIDSDGLPAHNALLWNDTRATDDLDSLIKAGKTTAIGQGSGTSLWPGTSGILWRWLKAHPSIDAQKISTVFTCADWIGYRLTGCIATDYSNASIPFFDLNTRAYSDKQFTEIACEDLQDKLPAPQRSTQKLGELRHEVALETGLPDDLPISTGTLDLAAMMVGMGLHLPGQTMLIMGTTAVVNILTATNQREDHPVGASVMHAANDTIIRVLAPSTGAAAFDWFTALHPKTLGGETSKEVAEKLNKLVKDVPVGSRGVTFLPYLNGERAPFVSPDMCGGFHGLRAHTSKADLGRAVMEGTAMSLRHCFESHSSLPPQPVQLTGGGSQNGVWCQIIADVLGQEVVVSTDSDQGLWGAAVIGAAAAGFGNPVTLSQRSEQKITYHPDTDAHQKYNQVFKRYERISTTMQRLQDELKTIKDETL